MFKRIFGPAPEQQHAADLQDKAFETASAAGDTATVRRIVARLEALPPERARIVASAAYTLARAAQADLDISDEETSVIEQAPQTSGAPDAAPPAASGTAGRGGRSTRRLPCW